MPTRRFFPFFASDLGDFHEPLATGLGGDEEVTIHDREALAPIPEDVLAIPGLMSALVNP